MKILLASVTNAPREILLAHLSSIQGLEVPEEVEVEMAYIGDSLDLPRIRLLERHGVRVLGATPKPSESSYRADESTHHWDIPTFHWLGHEKQRLMDLAVEEGFSHIFFVDSDLVLGPETLTSLISTGKEIVSAVFWTRWQPDHPPLPQVWLTHPYGFTGRSGKLHLEPHDFLRRLDEGDLMEVGGLGACTLISVSTLDRVRYSPILEGLPEGGMWEGEDRSFCIRATQNHIPLYADAWPDVFHLYRPSDLERLKEIEWPERKEMASIGYHISAILEPLEEPDLTAQNFQVHLRGRLGTLRLLPDLEEAILSTPVGEERIVEIEFPLWYPLEPYRGQTKHILLRMLDVKG